MIKMFAKFFELIAKYYSTAANTYRTFDHKHRHLSKIYNVYMALCAIGAVIGAIYLKLRHPRIFSWLSPKAQLTRLKEVKRLKQEFYVNSLQAALDADEAERKEVLPAGTFDDRELTELPTTKFGETLPAGTFDDRKIAKAYRKLMK